MESGRETGGGNKDMNEDGKKKEKCMRQVCSLDGVYLFSPHTASVSLGLNVFWSLGTR